MPVLTTQQRNTLESAVKKARTQAEIGSRNALHALAVDCTEPFAHLSSEQRTLRNRLRSKARLIGDDLPATGDQQLNHLAYELAYENWHKMLFAKFLETNNLLMHPSGVAITMEECEELAKDEGFIDKWDAAATYASKMLPAIFRPDDPLIQVSYASNDRINLEEILNGLDNDIFTADDALGWVYQFWQSEEKARINALGGKIDGEKLPAVTQLFTEPYMVHFLIDNTIGAWWVSQNPHIKPPVKFEYLRLAPDQAEETDNEQPNLVTPPNRSFEGWPSTTAAITAIDPCMGSGHFVASLFSVLAPLRMYEEGLSKEQATDKVIAENLHGLELDARCTQIAAFNLALTAWKFCGDYRPLPEMNLACSGIAPKGKKEDWVKLVGNVAQDQQKRMENGMGVLYDHFQLAPELGSLLDPSTLKPDAFTASFEELKPIVMKALENEADKDQVERGVMAAGIAKAGLLLAKKYTLLITNVPYLGRGRQKKNGILADYCLKNYPLSKGELANVFFEKMLISSLGTFCSVMPQNWLFQDTYKKHREDLLKNKKWSFLIKLGAGAFSQISGEVVKAILVAVSNQKPLDENTFFGIDVSNESNIAKKEEGIKTLDRVVFRQKNQLKNPDSKIILEKEKIEINTPLLQSTITSYQGIKTGDDNKFKLLFWENIISDNWKLTYGGPFSGGQNGSHYILNWKNKGKDFARFQGQKAFTKKGFYLTNVGRLSITDFHSKPFTSEITVLIPNEKTSHEAVYSYIISENYEFELRKIDQNLAISTGSVGKVPFDLAYWQKVTDEQYPNGLPQPYSNDATQWLFHGHPAKSDNPLQVGVARLLGYRWPAETDTEMELANEAKELIKQIKTFDALTDEDGILCIPPVNGELAASERLRTYLQAVYGTEWANNTISQLLNQEGAKKSNLEEWFREEFFEQHNRLFQNRPFIWHIWDGRKDGFSALVNYHKLDKENLQRLIFTYLGDWIRQCEAKKKAGESGAEGLLSAATKLKEKLETILEGEAPYDIFVRWKPLANQAIGWEPDLNDGIRLNIRPFILADILRKKPNIKWGIDRGNNPPGAFWGTIRDNDKHLSLAEKQAAKDK